MGDQDNSSGRLWRDVGEIAICEKGWPTFPTLGNDPGLYRITLSDGRVYIGQTSRPIGQRLYEYRRPTAGTEMEHVLHDELKSAGGGLLSVMIGPDMTKRTERQRIEREEITYARSHGTELLNPGVNEGTKTISARLKYHEREVERLRALLRDTTGNRTA